MTLAPAEELNGFPLPPPARARHDTTVNNQTSIQDSPKGPAHVGSHALRFLPLCLFPLALPRPPSSCTSLPAKGEESSASKHMGRTTRTRRIRYDWSTLRSPGPSLRPQPPKESRETHHASRTSCTAVQSAIGQSVTRRRPGVPTPSYPAPVFVPFLTKRVPYPYSLTARKPPLGSGVPVQEGYSERK